MLRRWLIGGLTIGLLASVLLAKPGMVTNRQGDTFKGDVTEDDNFVYINSPGGQLKLDKRNVEKIEYEKTVDEQYELRHSKLDPKDVRGRIDLAEWANQNQRADLAVKALTEARNIDPMNKEAGKALDAAQAQLELDEASKTKHPGTQPTTEPAKGGTPTAPTAPPVVVVPLDRRLLNNDEINIIRQREMKTDDPKIKVKFENAVVKKFLAVGDRDAAEFGKLSPEDQAIEILTKGDPSMAKDVRILTDPQPLVEFKTKIYPLISSGCAASACHGGSKAGNLQFFPGEGTSAVYTNFFITQTYSTTIDGVKYQLMDRDVPKHSLVLQFGLPTSMGTPPHPKVPNYRPRFKNDTDPAYTEIFDWLSNSLLLPQPDYGIKVAVKLPATQPAAAPAAPPK